MKWNLRKGNVVVKTEKGISKGYGINNFRKENKEEKSGQKKEEWKRAKEKERKWRKRKKRKRKG